MEAKNFRIGNIINVPNTGQIEPITATHNHLGVIINNSLAWIPLSEFKRVQLTKTWLLKLGFLEYANTLNFTIQIGVYYTCNQKNKKNSKLKIKLTKAGNWRVENFANKTIYITYVHELQNLFFALTGTELELKSKSSACS